MKPTSRFHHDRTATALAMLEGSHELKVHAINFGGRCHVEVELHAQLPPDDAGAVIRSLLGQLGENARRDQDEDDDD